MKILCKKFSNALFYIMEGCKDALCSAGNEWRWLGQGEAVIEVFDRYKPDIFIGATYEMDRATIKAIYRHPEVKVVMKGNNWGDSDFAINHEEYPIGVVNEKEKVDVLTLKASCGKPDLVFNFYHKQRMEWTMGQWDREGITTFPLLPAANHFKYKPVEPDENLRCDIAFVGGYWRYKAINLDRYIVPLCYPVGKRNIKIFGNQHWPVPQYLGEARDETVLSLFSSALICPNVSEPHANKFGFEVNERIFKLAACKAFVISDKTASLTEDIFTKNELVVADNPHDFHGIIDMFLANPSLRDNYVEKLHKTVMESHTYVHRMRDMLTALGLQEEAGKLCV